MTIYYVDSNLAGGSGLTPSTAFATIQAAHDVSVAGDTIYIMPGKGYGGGATDTAVLVISRSGSAAGGYITYSGYPGLPMPVINGIIGTGANSDQTIQFGVFGWNGNKPTGYIIFNNLHFAGNSGSLNFQSAWGDAFAKTGTSIYNNSCISCAGLGAQNSGSVFTTTAGSSNTTLALATSDGAGHPITGIQVGDVVADITSQSRIPKGTTVVSVSSPNITMSASASGVLSGDSIRIFHPIHHVQILNCIIHDFPANGVGFDFVDYFTISNCLIYNCAWYCNNATSGIEAQYQALDVDANTSTYKNIYSGNIVFNNANLVPWTAANTVFSTTANGGTSNTTLVVASAASAVLGMGIQDSTSNGRILAGTYITNIVGNTLTLSTAANGVVNGDTIQFCAFSDGEGILLDDTAGDQNSGVIYAGKTLITNNICAFNGSSGIQIFDSANVDVTFNTCYKNMAHPAYAPFLGYGDIYYASNNPGRSVSGLCANNIVQTTALVTPYIALGYNGGSAAGVTLTNNMSFGNATAIPGSNNITNTDPKFVAPPSTTVTYTAGTTRGVVVANGDVITRLVPADIGSAASPSAAFPGFTAFQLQPGSPAIDAGSVSATRTVDFLGNVGQLGPAYDMGAYESPCSPWGGNPIQTIISFLDTSTGSLKDNTSGAIMPLNLREVLTTLLAGKSPYPR